MKRIEYVCDGCDLVMHAEFPTDGGTDSMLDGWILHRIVRHENGRVVGEVVADLCPSCSDKLRHAINPANWPRMDATVRQFAKK